MVMIRSSFAAVDVPRVSVLLQKQCDRLVVSAPPIKPWG